MCCGSGCALTSPWVAQTLDALLQQAADVRPVPLAQGRNQEVAAGTRFISTAQGVARAQWRTQGYDADGDDDVRDPGRPAGPRPCQGLADSGWWWSEAHISLDKGTEFGKFAHWLRADYLLLATATARKTSRLTDFVAHAGYGVARRLPGQPRRCWWLHG